MREQFMSESSGFRAEVFTRESTVGRGFLDKREVSRSEQEPQMGESFAP